MIGASSEGVAKRASSGHAYSRSGAGNKTQVRRKAWIVSEHETSSGARLEKRKGKVAGDRQTIGPDIKKLTQEDQFV